jgi:hypothetical protein
LRMAHANAYRIRIAYGVQCRVSSTQCSRTPRRNPASVRSSQGAVGGQPARQSRVIACLLGLRTGERLGLAPAQVLGTGNAQRTTARARSQATGESKGMRRGMRQRLDSGRQARRSGRVRRRVRGQTDAGGEAGGVSGVTPRGAHGSPCREGARRDVERIRRGTHADRRPERSQA